MNAGRAGLRHVELGDHLAALHAAAQLGVEIGVVRLRIVRELVRVAPIELAVGRHVVAGVLGKGARLVGVREPHQPPPFGRAERELALGKRQIRTRPAGSTRTRRPGGIRETPDRWRTGSRRTRSPVSCRRSKSSGRSSTFAMRDAPLDLPALLKPQRDRRDRSEQSVAADRQREQTRVDGAAADLQMAARRRGCVNDSTSATNGRRRRPRPWMFAASAPPSVR